MATRFADGSYSSMCGFSVLGNSPGPSDGVVVSRTRLSPAFTEKEYQSTSLPATPLPIAPRTTPLPPSGWGMAAVSLLSNSKLALRVTIRLYSLPSKSPNTAIRSETGRSAMALEAKS